MKISLTNCEQLLLLEIATDAMQRRDIAKTYRFAMESYERDKIDWGKVNRAIIDRWSVSGLVWIKRQAHSGGCFK